jgi:hypothetical protein
MELGSPKEKGRIVNTWWVQKDSQNAKSDNAGDETKPITRGAIVFGITAAEHSKIRSDSSERREELGAVWTQNGLVQLRTFWIMGSIKESSQIEPQRGDGQSEAHY